MLSARLKPLVDILRWRYTGGYWLLSCLQHHLFFSIFRRLRAQRRAWVAAEVMRTAPAVGWHDGHAPDGSILYLLHWFELGGAESFALEAIKAAKAAGFSTHVFATEPSAHGDFGLFADVADRLGAADALPDAEALAKYVVENGIRILHIHHSNLGYRSLPLLRQRCPRLYVIDSTHIVEYRDGGFPQLAARYSDYINVHHVISMQLADYIQHTYRELHGRVMNRHKIALAYLLPSASIRPPVGGAVTSEGAVRVLFYGRIENQKQPYLFCRLVELLNESSAKGRLGLVFKGVVVGTGSLAASMTRYHADALREGRLEWLGRVDDKDYVYSHADILVLLSRNEGITLTSYEAIARGLPVVSSDVGAQSELLPSEMLVDIWRCNPLTEFVSRITRFVTDEDFKKAAMERAATNYARLAGASADRNWLVSLYTGHDLRSDNRE